MAISKYLNFTKLTLGPFFKNCQALGSHLNLGSQIARISKHVHIYEWSIRERSLGIFEGQSISEFNEAQKRYGEDFAPENGESYGDSRNRARDFIKSIPKQLE